MSDELTEEVSESHGREYSLVGLEEHEVLERFILQVTGDLPDNIVQIISYGSTEMLNNAIDHSEGTTVRVFVVLHPEDVKIFIVDNGVGIFNKIQRILRLEAAYESIIELCKGKLTTDPEHHTGEGIFFTSRAFDQFHIMSDALTFGHTNERDWLLDATDNPYPGTVVAMQISRRCTKTLKDVFDRFSTGEVEVGFTRTHFPISIAQFGPEGLVSRSMAKRILNRFSKFKEVVLDFEGVDSIGQSFADEIFRVFPKSHPDVHLQVVNAIPDVMRMIQRAMNNAREDSEQATHKKPAFE